MQEAFCNHKNINFQKHIVTDLFLLEATNLDIQCLTGSSVQEATQIQNNWKILIQEESMENHNNGENMAAILEVESIQGH